MLCLLALALLAGCGQGGRPPQGPPDVGYVVIRAEPVELKTVLPGRTNPFAVSDVRPQVGGILKARLFTEGGAVTAGQPLYQIDPSLYRATYDNAQAVLAAAKAKAARYSALLRQNAISHQDYDDADAAYKQALANAQTARINLDYTTITAPISGRIGRSAFTQGALVAANQATALATIQTLDPIYVDITQSSTELLNLKLAVQGGRLTRDTPAEAPVTLELDNGTAYPIPGKLQFSEVTVDQTTGSVTLRAIFPNPNGVLLPGMFVRATIVEAVDRAGILAPQQGVSHNEKGDPTALIVDAKGFARLRVLKTSGTLSNKWIVTGGLRPGDKLIVQGLQKAQPDQPVHAVPAAPQTPGPPGKA